MGYARLYLFALSTAAVEMADAIAVLNWARVRVGVDTSVVVDDGHTIVVATLVAQRTKGKKRQ